MVVLEEAEEFTKQLPTLLSGLAATSSKLTWNQFELLLRYRFSQFLEYLIDLLGLEPRELGSIKVIPEGRLPTHTRPRWGATAPCRVIWATSQVERSFSRLRIIQPWLRPSLLKPAQNPITAAFLVGGALWSASLASRLV